MKKAHGKKRPPGRSAQRDVYRVPVYYHLFAGGWIVAMLLFGNFSPQRYSMAMQEDRVVEWGTVWLFGVAAAIGLYLAIRRRSVFDGLVALFCLFVAGEEFSWGQRVFGFYPPEYFLAHNYQQETNVHNLPQDILKPKWVLMIALVGYGIVLPLLVPRIQSSRLARVLRISAPPARLMPWFVAAIVILLWYPLTLTGEWVELLAGSLFVVSLRPRMPVLMASLALAFVFGGAMIWAGAALERSRDAGRIPCAAAETRRLLDDSIAAANRKLWRKNSVHKRLFTAINDGYLRPGSFGPFDEECGNSDVRQRYAIDPWGTAYWIQSKRVEDRKRYEVVVYSFGPNRQRDKGGDDITATKVVTR